MVQKSCDHQLRWLVVYPHDLPGFSTIQTVRWLALGVLNHQQTVVPHHQRSSARMKFSGSPRRTSQFPKESIQTDVMETTYNNPETLMVGTWQSPLFEEEPHLLNLHFFVPVVSCRVEVNQPDMVAWKFTKKDDSSEITPCFFHETQKNGMVFLGE